MDEDTLSKRIKELEEELDSLRAQQASKCTKRNELSRLPLELEEYIRYGRQMILPQVGLPGQLALKKSSVLVIGAGGLGCPVLLYLAGAGIGTIGIADHDTVDLSNLHRQILHRTSSIGRLKTRSAETALKQLNPSIKVICHDDGITPQNAVSSMTPYDIIVDCTDAPSTRYLISDTCVVLSKSLVSGSALGTEGQLVVYGYNNGPCYRCMFPTPPPAEAVLTCGEGGILGPVVGVIGVMQALETIKVMLHANGVWKEEYIPQMTIFGAFDVPQWRSFKMRPRKKDCIACGLNPSVSEDTIAKTDYSVICKRVIPDEIPERITVTEYSQLKNDGHVLIDVRDKTQFGICSLPDSLNIPYSDFMEDPATALEDIPRNKELFVVCRFGNDSQLAVDLMKKDLNFENVKDIKGGLDAWAETFPEDIIPKY